MICCTHPGKIGDALYSLPTIKALCNLHNTKADFYTSYYCKGLKNLIEYQPYINKFYVSSRYEIKRWDMGIQPYEIPLDTDGYEKVYHLGFRSVPNKALDKFIAEQAGVSSIEPLHYEHQNNSTLDEPYVVLAPHNDSRYRNTFLEFIRTSPYKTVIVGTKDEYLGEGIDQTGLDFLDELSWMANSVGFIGVSAHLVLAEGFPIPKVVPHDGHTFDMTHLLYDNYHVFPINPSSEELIRIIRSMSTFSKTLNPKDYDTLDGYAKHIENILDHLKHIKAAYRFEHEHRKWEYAMIYKALDTIKSETVLDIGGGGSIFAPAMAWVGMKVHQVDPGDVGEWVKSQSMNLTHDQIDFFDYHSDTKFDAVVAISVIEHVDDDIGFFKKMLSHVRVGGIVALTTDFHESGKQMVGGHIRTYNEEKLENLISIGKKSGFKLLGDDYDYSNSGYYVNGCNFVTLILKKEK